jgi:hypothetical protein
VQHEAEREPVPDGAPEPTQVPCRLRSRCGVGLDFDADYPAVAEFHQYVDFMPAIRVADMKEPGRKLAHGAPGPQLRHYEAVEEPAQQVSVAKNRPGIHAQQRADECGVDQVTLRQPDEAVQPVG